MLHAWPSSTNCSPADIILIRALWDAASGWKGLLGRWSGSWELPAEQVHFPVEPPIDFIYLPLAQSPRTAMTLLLHTAGAPGDLAGPLRDLVRSLDAGQPVIGIRTMEEIFDQRARGTLNVLLRTIGGMGLLGLVLALVGLYGLMTYSVGLRQREIGIRMAIGADRLGVMKMVLKQGLVLAGIGVAIGVSVLLLASKPVMKLGGCEIVRLESADSCGGRSAGRRRFRGVPSGSPRFAGGSE